MRYRPLGERGPTVPVVGVGGTNFGSRLDEDGTKAVVHAALDAGVTFFDTADVYAGFGEGGGLRGDGERRLGAARTAALAPMPEVLREGRPLPP
ncbi:aldo/keto reductase [Streptomyces sp. NPDC006132]|uniref:aldo/keto reductase n=1 Tax=Streptomyces sp. NPDC006132 TaxID=3156732 RepID=UPI0033EB0743